MIGVKAWAFPNGELQVVDPLCDHVRRVDHLAIPRRVGHHCYRGPIDAGKPRRSFAYPPKTDEQWILEAWTGRCRTAGNVTIDAPRPTGHFVPPWASHCIS